MTSFTQNLSDRHCYRDTKKLPLDAARCQRCCVRQFALGLQLGRDSAQSDEPHAQGIGARPAAAQGDLVHVVPCFTTDCYHLELSRQLSCLYCNPPGQPACQTPSLLLAAVSSSSGPAWKNVVALHGHVLGLAVTVTTFQLGVLVSV